MYGQDESLYVRTACKTCGRAIVTYASQTAGKGRTFCSRECETAWQRQQTMRFTKESFKRAGKPTW